MNKHMYTRQEADELGIAYHPWRSPAVQPGEYILSDDDIVVRVKTRHELTNNRGYPSLIYWTIAGYCFPAGAHFKCSAVFEGRHNVGNRAENRAEDNRLSVREKNVLELVMNGYSPVEAVEKVFTNNSRSRVRSKARMILKKRAAVKYMSNQIKEKLDKAGLTEDWWFQQIKAMVSDPDVKSEVRWDMLKTAGQMHDLIEAPSKAQISETRTVYLDQDSIERLEQKQVMEISE